MRIIPRQGGAGTDEGYQAAHEVRLPRCLDEKVQLLRPYIEKSHDINSRPFYFNGPPRVEACAVYVNGVIDVDLFDQHILRPLMLYEHQGDFLAGGKKQDPVDIICRSFITTGLVRKTEQLGAVVQYIFDGMLVLMFDGLEEVLAIDIHRAEHRAIDEPTAERALRGPREGFIENLDINISLIRSRLRDPRLIIEKTLVGQRSRTQVATLFIEDIADPQVVAEVKSRIGAINIDGVVAVGMIEEFLEDNPYSPFPQYKGTAKPDKVVMDLLEGRVAIMVDGTPTVILAPSLLVEFFQATDDYYERAYIASYIRLLRFFAYFMAVSLPALYIALISYQPELIPSDLLVPLTKARAEVPFPSVFEILVMEIIMELVIEAGLRLPGIIGQTVGVVAGVVMGQAAISAKLASPGAVIVVALATMCSFSLPAPAIVLNARILRLPMILAAATFGLFGFSFAWFIVICHLAGLDSMGVPYLSPWAPARYSDWKDTLIRSFLKNMKKRPVSVPGQDKIRQGEM